MKVKIFSGDDKQKLEDEINAWIKATNAIVQRGDLSINMLSVPVVTNGKKSTRKIPYFGMSVWY